jgi:3-methyl-2-oxobutanoate hydroxymethyltransferase
MPCWTTQPPALLDDAAALVEAGVFSIVLEGIPGPLAARITEQVEVPTIGIGAGVHCDGQVLVFHDLLGMSAENPPKFVRRYAHILESQIEAIRRWTEDVRGGSFPSDDETYS